MRSPLHILAASFLVVVLARGAVPAPAWLAAAVHRLPEEIPSDLAYTVEIDRSGQRTVERFDPRLPAEGRWTLLARQGRAPSADEILKYARERALSSEPAYRSSIRRGQIDLVGARVLEESATQATVQLGFVPAAIAADRMLGRLELVCEIHKEPAAVRSYRLRLPAPYSPVIGVKMLLLDAGAEFDSAARPRRTWSRFRGRIFFRSVDESVEATYRDYVSPHDP